jgi:DNA adenine methylase
VLDEYPKTGYSYDQGELDGLQRNEDEPMQLHLFDEVAPGEIPPFRDQLLKWVGNKQRVAYQIASYFPRQFGRYFEPFLGSAAVLGTLAPERAVGSDLFRPLVEIWQMLRTDPEMLKRWYAERWHLMMAGDKVAEYERIRTSYNENPNAADLLFLCRSCYGGVVRFRQTDGYMSTPCGVHKPMPPERFSRRVDDWYKRTSGTTFALLDYEEAMNMAVRGDVIYCDPPYTYSQTILYGAQAFDLERLFGVIERCKARGVLVVLSIDGTKRSGDFICDVPIPEGLFEREVAIPVGRSMLKRFQMDGQTLAGEEVADRLLLTYR